VARLILGMPATVTVPQIAEPLPATISEIGSAAGPGNVFPVKAALTDPPAAIRAGMTAEVTLRLPLVETAPSFFVPLSAVAPGERSGEGFVFVYDPQSSTVRRTVVRATATLAGNTVAVTGLKAGDVIASAGVVFLVDGKKVKLMQPAWTAGRG
jgi:multidrug efflux pump subunit AcrA (membrane-fusion protein)